MENAGVSINNDEGLQNLWTRFFNYEASCLKADLVAGMVPVGGTRWAFMAGPYENVVSRGDRLIMLEPDIERLAARLGTTQSLQYGWPLVALDSGDGLKVAPLFVLDVAPPPYPANSITIFGDPVINPAVVRSLLTNKGDIDFLRTQLGDGFPKGEAQINSYIENICRILGLPAQPLDCSSINHDIPQEQGVYNSAVMVIVESMPTVRPVIEELRQLANRRDWIDTSAAALFGIDKPTIEGRTNMPVMPWSTEEAFEKSLQLVRRNAMTVFNMSQRDVVDQLLVSIASNAWVDGESVLVVCDDERRQNEVSKLACDIHNALLVRTCCDADRSMKRNSKATPLSALAVKLKDEIEATLPSLPTVLAKVDTEMAPLEEFRTIALAGAKRREALVKQKQDLEMKRMELAKRIWSGGLMAVPVDASAMSQEIAALEKSWFCAGMRKKSLLGRLKAKPSATIDDVKEWCATALELKNVEHAMKDFHDVDKFNVGSVNYRWATTSIGVVSARVSERLSKGVQVLDHLANTQARDLQTVRAVSDSVNYLRGWMTDYDTASAYFKLAPNIFDIVVLDNSHRWNLAWALPLAYRAKRVVVIGDMQAASHNVFLDDEQMRNLANRYEFERETMMERCLDYSVSNIYAAFSHAS